MTEENWAGSYTYRAAQIHRPDTIDSVRRLVAQESKIRALGSRHSFHDLPDSPGVLVSLDSMPRTVHVDAEAQTVTVSAGTRYGDLATELHRAGWALSAMASLPHIAVAGAIGTGTHGSGDRVGSLAAQVVGLELIDAGGELRTLTDGDDDFAGAVVHLGALGVLTSVTLRVEPTYDVQQYVVNDVPWEFVEAQFEEVMSAAYSVSIMTRWNTRAVQVWLKSRDGEVSLPAGKPATKKEHPAGRDPEGCTEQLGEAGPWQDRLPHFRMGFTPSSGREIQAEYLLPRAHARDAISALRELGPIIAPLLQTCEIRTVAADDLWLSGSYGRDTVAFHFTLLPEPVKVRALLGTIEQALAGLEARPHWGKWFSTSAEDIAAMYPRMEDFRALVGRSDPHGKFSNSFLERVVLGR
ncbi:FAD-binding protein [Ruania halotolerans]|uniref:FAD-binding protein n=1 Tax=Ruania halotolerans TaxID=2897773 RepID=UPI001E3A6F95|nr:FAD-binding protein [Ruania halotolerans]UFU05553.1 FAD-binding protein [Ruania halotolerans]